ncbi:MAG: NfeD family protein [Clostridiaceae bacterium]|nr:NfeD family protein [Clostridiaceae bacterium]
MEGYIPYTWLGILVLLIIIEAATVNLTTIWFAAGSLVAFFLSLLNLPLWLQIAVFLIVSAVLLIYTRPVAVKYLRVGRYRTNADALIGGRGVVIMDITEHSTGQVKVRGQIWTAVSRTGQPILKDTEVVICGIEGVKLIVKAADQIN